MGGGGGLGEETGAEGSGVFLQGFGGAGVLQTVEQDPELLVLAECALDEPQAVFARAAGRFAARLRGGCRVRRELLRGGRRFRIGPGGRERGFGAGTLTGICADGTMLKLNPVLRPRMEALIAEYTKRHGLGGAEFLFAGDATLLGCAWAALA